MKKQNFLKLSYTAAIAVMLMLILVLPATMVSQKTLYMSPLRTPGDPDDENDKTLSPYFVINSDNPELDKLPLKETKADVNIAGVIADVKITQTYVNSGKSTIEAIYVFPASTRAAVYDMKMTIGDRILIAKIQEKEQARKDYEAAKDQGKSASLLEQDRPNVFQMNVANILPGDTISIEMKYTELLIPTEGIYEFVYPTVVGPRYSNKSESTASANDTWVANPYTKEGVNPTYGFDIQANLVAGMKIKAISCPTHDVKIDYLENDHAVIKLKKSEKFEGDRDFILQYKLADNAIESGLLLYKGENDDENFFLTMIQPPAKPEIDMIPPREYIFIMDVSGSMSGFPIETSKKLMENLIKKLRPIDKFNLMLFAGSSTVLSQTSLFATEENLKKALELVDKQSGGGGTELLPALTKALKIEKAEGYSRSFVIATDGYVDIEKETFELIRNNLGKANFFAFGIGSSVNRYLIEGMAHCGMGEPFIVTGPDQASKKAEKFREYIQSPVLTDVSVSYNGFNVYDIEPLNIPDVLAQRPIIIYGKWKGEAKGMITVTGKTGGKDFSWSVNVADIKPLKENHALKYLWVRQKIRMLDDFNNVGSDQKIQDEITSLGLKYNLLTNYTSFIAIDSLVRNTSGKSTSVKQPLPLPQGVSNYAIGEKMSSMSSQSSGGTLLMCKSISVVSDKAEEDSISYSVATTAEYIGGEKAMKEFIKANLVYPAEAKKNGVSGKLYLQFTIDALGNISDIKVIKSLGSGCDEEAIRVVKLMSGKWIPSKQNGVSISSTYYLPIKFTLK
jgi:Ca-activated chloride channel homolog